MTKEAPVCFNMDLANAPTGARFCYEAAAVLGEEIPEEDARVLDARDGQYGFDSADDAEAFDDLVREWSDKLDSAGYYVRWDAGDVVVFDLRGFTDEERDEWFAEVES